MYDLEIRYNHGNSVLRDVNIDYSKKERAFKDTLKALEKYDPKFPKGATT